MDSETNIPSPSRTDRSQLARYLAPIILGMDDAIVELTGALAGFTIALDNSRLIALAGLTTGIAATLSMAASEFLSQEAGQNRRNPWKAAFLCGLTYLGTIIFLLAPFFVFSSPAKALMLSLIIAVIIIFVFTAIISHIKRTDFKTNFLRMLLISFGVAAIAFIITWIARTCWGVSV